MFAIKNRHFNITKTIIVWNKWKTILLLYVCWGALIIILFNVDVVFDSWDLTFQFKYFPHSDRAFKGKEFKQIGEPPLVTLAAAGNLSSNYGH